MTIPPNTERPDALSGDRGAVVPGSDAASVLRLAMRVAVALLALGALTDDAETAMGTVATGIGVNVVAPVDRYVRERAGSVFVSRDGGDEP